MRNFKYNMDHTGNYIFLAWDPETVISIKNKYKHSSSELQSEGGCHYLGHKLLCKGGDN